MSSTVEDSHAYFPHCGRFRTGRHTLPPSSAHAAVTITISQIGSDVVASGTGTLDTHALDEFVGTQPASAFMLPFQGVIIPGTTTSIPTEQYTNFTGPPSLGPRSNLRTRTTGSGDAFGFDGSQQIITPNGWPPGATLSYRCASRAPTSSLAVHRSAEPRNSLEIRTISLQMG
jgi:hypothetical protein